MRAGPALESWNPPPTHPVTFKLLGFDVVSSKESGLHMAYPSQLVVAGGCLKYSDTDVPTAPL